MAENNFSNLIGTARYKLASNVNTNARLQVEQKTKPLIEYDVIDIVNQYEIFTEEREKSKKYRINGKFNIYTSNVLSTGSSVYVGGKFTDSTWSPMFYGPTANSSPSNWVMQITYPSNSITDYDIKSYTNFNELLSTKVYRGLQFQGLGGTIINRSYYLTVRGVQKHNLAVGDYVHICSSINGTYQINNLQGVYRVRDLGIDGQNLDKDLTLDVIVKLNQVPSYSPGNNLRFGNFVRVFEPSVDDTNGERFSLLSGNSVNILNITSTDISGNTVTFGGNERYAKIKTRTPHKLVKNNFVEIKMNSGSSLQTPNGVWRVYNVLGSISGSTEFIVKVNVFPANQIGYSYISSNNLPDQCRLFGGIPSEYYVRQFEVLTTNDYNVYPCAFSSTIYPEINDYKFGVANDTWLFQFDQDIDLERLKTDRNGPISDLYYTVIKRAGKNPTWPNQSTDGWSSVTAHWDFNSKFPFSSPSNGLELISDYTTNGIGSIEKISGRTEFIDSTGNIQAIPGSKYIGEITEFNSGDLTEKTSAEIIHRFGLSSQPNKESYYYKPFRKLEIRKYSNFVETAESDQFVINIPNNYVTYADNSIAWKDLLSIGYFEENTNGVEYPFLNGKHYYYFNHNLYIRRQNPITTLTSDTFVLIATITEEC